MNLRQEDDMNTRILRILPFWPTVWGVISMVGIGATAVTTIYARVDDAAKNIEDIKRLAISTSGKLNDVKTEQSVQHVQILEISRRVGNAENHINMIRHDVYMLQDKNNRAKSAHQ